MSDPLRAGIRCRCNDGAPCAAERHVGPAMVILRLQQQRDALWAAAREAADVHYECRCVGCERLRALIKQLES